jgi:hypothetical protein
VAEARRVTIGRADSRISDPDGRDMKAAGLARSLHGSAGDAAA